MKRALIVACTLTITSLVAGTALAQDNRSFDIGAKGGITFADLRGTFADPDIASNSNGFGLATGYAFGASVGIHVRDGVAFQPEVLLVRRATSLEAGSDRATVRAHYIEVPLLLAFSFERGGAARPVVFAGPVVAFEAGSTLKEIDGGDGTTTTTNVSEDLKSVDFGIAFGGGVDFDRGNQTYRLEARYTVGLTEAIADESAADFGSFKWGTLAILAGVTF